jgi:amidophosphoribosyltransferase
LVLVHNGNLTNTPELKRQLFEHDHRHINTDSDSEVLLNVLAHELEQTTRGLPLKAADVFGAVRGVHRRIRGSYAVISLIAGHGVLAFRDPYGIRPLCVGRGADGTYMVASESVTLEGTGHQLERFVEPGEAIFMTRRASCTASNAPKKRSSRPVFLSLCIWRGLIPRWTASRFIKRA